MPGGHLAGQQRPDAEELVDHPLLLLPVDLAQIDGQPPHLLRLLGRQWSSTASAAAVSRLATRMAAFRRPRLDTFMVVMLTALPRYVHLSDPGPQDVGGRVGVFLHQFGEFVAERRAAAG